MKLTIFEYRDYKTYLNDWIASQPQKGRGKKSAIAEALQCQKAYVSQILAGGAHFSLEQADSLNEYLGHTAEEGHFLFLLIQYDRAGKPTLKKYFRDQIEKAAGQRLLIKNRIGVKDTLSREAQATYYSAWYYAAIHMMLGIERLQTKEAISRRSGLSPKKVTEVLEFLVSLGLARQKAIGRFEIGPTRLHLERDSPMISKHHTNWRMQAIRALDRGAEEDLHYSVILSISEEDLPKLKAMLVGSIQEFMKLAHASSDESVHCFTLDFFPV